LLNLLQPLQNRILSLTPVGRMSSSVFPAQYKFLQSGAKRKAALCTRRAGKSHIAAIYLLLRTQLSPGSVGLYLALTRRSAKKIMWYKLKDLNRTYNLNLTFLESELVVKLPNGSRIELVGADTENVADRLRGDAYIVVIVDEAQAFGSHLDYLIDDAIEPATMDLDGDIVLLGTPGALAAGTFFNATQQDSFYEVHKWSILDNIYIPHAKNWLADLKKRRKWSDDNPTYRREYLGEWCHDPSALVYKFNERMNTYETLPDYDFNYVIGLDYGWNDATAFCVLAYSDHYPDAFIVDCYGHSEMIPSRVAQELRRLMGKYNPERIIADTGGLGKSITEEMRIRYELPIIPAEKTEKYMAIDTINGDFIDKRLYINKKLTPLINQMQNLTWDDKHKENPALPNDYCDATLYAHRFSRHYWGQVPVKISPEKKLEMDIMQYAEERNTRNWVDDL